MTIAEMLVQTTAKLMAGDASSMDSETAGALD